MAKTLCMAAVTGVLLVACLEEDPAGPGSSNQDAGAAARDVGPLLDGGLPASDAEPMDRFHLPETGFDASAGDAASSNLPARDSAVADGGLSDAGPPGVDEFCQAWELPFPGRIAGNDRGTIWALGQGGVAHLVDGAWRRVAGTEELNALSGWVAPDGTLFFAAQPLDAGPLCRELFLYRYEGGQLIHDAVFDSSCPPRLAANSWCDQDWACFTTEMVARSKNEVYVGWAKDVLRWDGNAWSVLYVNGPDDAFPWLGEYEHGHGPCEFGNNTSSTAVYLGLVGDRGVYAICDRRNIEIDAYVFNGEEWIYGGPSPPYPSRAAWLGPPDNASILAYPAWAEPDGWHWIDIEGVGTYAAPTDDYPSAPLGGTRPDLTFGVANGGDFWMADADGVLTTHDLRSYVAIDEQIRTPFFQGEDTLWATRVRPGLPSEALRCDLSRPAPTCDDITQCPTGYFCAAPQCSGPGTCKRAVNLPCSADFDPVCGCDSITYTNYCHARSAAERVEREGSCF